MIAETSLHEDQMDEGGCMLGLESGRLHMTSLATNPEETDGFDVTAG